MQQRITSTSFSFITADRLLTEFLTASTGKSLIDLARQTKLLSQETQKVLEEIFREYGTLLPIKLIARVYKEYPNDDADYAYPHFTLSSILSKYST